MKDYIKREQIGNYIYELVYDEVYYEWDNPRELDNFGTMICFHNRYKLGDRTVFKSSDFNSFSELKEALMEEDVHTILPIYMYDHSGITISTSSFSCRWDSGQIGFIYVTNKRVKEDGIADEKVASLLDNEVELYDKYLRGESYAYRILKLSTCDLGHTHEEELEYVGGYFDKEDCESDAINYLNHINNEKVSI